MRIAYVTSGCVIRVNGHDFVRNFQFVALTLSCCRSTLCLPCRVVFARGLGSNSPSPRRSTTACRQFIYCPCSPCAHLLTPPARKQENYKNKKTPQTKYVFSSSFCCHSPHSVQPGGCLAPVFRAAEGVEPNFDGGSVARSALGECVRA